MQKCYGKLTYADFVSPFLIVSFPFLLIFPFFPLMLLFLHKLFFNQHGWRIECLRIYYGSWYGCATSHYLAPIDPATDFVNPAPVPPLLTVIVAHTPVVDLVSPLRTGRHYTIHKFFDYDSEIVE